ncbi:hypothetical protein TRFO_29772 [Tritrichomonas foetus]|uniref:Uncharacterized protein n=1 Tax=Tritrichomonas foetus TaxID=1144522 RepID=A0A1J4JWX7_9EUKA|nr:hypothetical protein TRFO_29772 [Tritrichomonas foetus]|eukprot:OHT02960.1 hypothetical protein TRFO_29772 [Tritrichomonas foetus]
MKLDICPDIIRKSYSLTYEIKILQHFHMKVSLVLDDDTTIPATLKVYIQKGNVLFEYLDQNDHSIIRDSITQFRSIQFSEENALKTTIHGPLIDRVIQFESMGDHSKFYNFLRENVQLEPSETDPRSFIIKEKQTEQKQPTLTDFVHTIVKTIVNKNEPSIIKRPVDGFTYGTIVQILPSNKLVPLTREEAETAILSSLPLNTYSISHELFPIIFTRLINPPDLSSEYKKLKEQWQLTSKAEWDYFLKMRVFVHSVEKYLEKTSRLTTETHKQLFFNISLALFTRYFSELSFGPKLMCVIELIINCFLKETSDGDSFDLMAGGKLGIEETEILLFSHISEIWEIVTKSQLSVEKESFNILNALSTISPSTKAILDDRNMKLLDFAIPDADLFFTRGKNLNDSLLLFAAALATGDIAVFRKNVICSSLVLLHERLQLIPINDTKTFSETYCMELRNIKARLLILNNIKIHLSQQHSS